MPPQDRHAKDRPFKPASRSIGRRAGGNRELADAGGFNPRRCLGFSFGTDDASIEGQLLASGDVPGTGKSGPWVGEFSGHATDARDVDEGVGGGRQTGGGSARPQP